MKLLRLPGLIDIHVHLRDPGETYKEDFYTGTRAALASGVTTIFDMPNNLTPIFTHEALEEKLAIAKRKAVCDFGLYFGTDGYNTDQFEDIANQVVGLKLYLNMTTGKYLVEDEDLIRKIFETWPKHKVLTVHAKENKVDLAIELCRRYSNKLHVAHVSNREMLEKIIDAKKEKLPVTCEVAPHHLFLTDDSSNVQPPLASQKDQDFLWENLRWVDCIATDHAPHLLSEKKSSNPPSGLPGVESILPLLLTAVKDGKLTIEEIIRLTNINPKKIFNIEQEDSFVEVDIDDEYRIENKNIMSKCSWSPFAGWTVSGRIKKVYLRGTKVVDNGKILVPKGFGNYIN